MFTEFSVDYVTNILEYTTIADNRAEFFVIRFNSARSVNDWKPHLTHLVANKVYLPMNEDPFLQICLADLQLNLGNFNYLSIWIYQSFSSPLIPNKKGTVDVF